MGEVRNVDRLYLESDALILVSIYEALPAVIMEAMIKGCFVIASDICDNSLAIGNEERGLLCQPLNPESICDAIQKLNVLSLKDRTSTIKNAREFAELYFNDDTMAIGYESLLNKDDKSNK